MSVLSPGLLLRAYQIGVFPMADSKESPDIIFVEPNMRGIIPFRPYHISKRLRRTIRNTDYTVTVDKAYKDVMLGCADRDDTWINQEILNSYVELYDLGYGHSVEVWDGDRLVGGLYGVSIGGVFCGESMFHYERDASKIAMVHLIARLSLGGYKLLDTQFITDHLATMGAIEITQQDYKRRLEGAIVAEANFYCLPSLISGSAAIQSITQTS